MRRVESVSNKKGIFCEVQAVAEMWNECTSQSLCWVKERYYIVRHQVDAQMVLLEYVCMI